MLWGVRGGHCSCYRDGYRNFLRAFRVAISHKECSFVFQRKSGRTVSVENRLWCYRRIQEFFFLRCNVDLAGWQIEVFCFIAAMFSLQRLASNFIVSNLFELIGAWSSLMLHGWKIQNHNTFKPSLHYFGRIWKRSFISKVRSSVHNKPLRKQSF